MNALAVRSGAPTPTNSAFWEISTCRAGIGPLVKNWRQRPGILGFRFTFNQPHQQAGGFSSLDWFWSACEQEEGCVGLWPAV
jgi:hypothetical protein